MKITDEAVEAPTDTQEGPSEVDKVMAYLMEGSTVTWLQSTSGLADCDKPSVTPVPLVRQSALTACQQEVERLQGMLSGTNKVITGMSRDFTAAHDAYEARILELEADLEIANDLIRKKDEALRNIRELNLTRPGADGLRWARSDLIEQEIVFALGGQSNG